jgi:toxin ParE1/3/4
VNPSFQLTPAASAHVDAIGDFIAERSGVAAAIQVLDALDDAFVQLANMPEMGHTREDLTEQPVKFWSVYSYLITYDPSSSPLRILAVLHGARDVEQLLKDIGR